MKYCSASENSISEDFASKNLALILFKGFYKSFYKLFQKTQKNT